MKSASGTLALALATLVAAGAAAAQELVALTLVHTNDRHGHLLGGAGEPSPVSRLEQLLATQRRGDESPLEDTLVVDAGDLFEGTALDHLTRGRMMTDSLGRLRYDAWTLGNHDFAFGRAELARRVAEAREAGVAVLGANVVDVPSGRTADDLASPYALVERDGLNVAILGLGHPGTAGMNDPASTRDLEFQDPMHALRQWARRLDGADLVVVVLHGELGRTEEQALAAMTDLPANVRVFVEAHTHRAAPAPRLIRLADGRSALAVQAGSQGQFAGRLTVWFDKATGRLVLDGAAPRFEYDLADLRAPAGTEAPTAEAGYFYETYARQHADRLERPVGRAAAAWGRPGKDRKDPFGNLLTDAERAAALRLFDRGALAALPGLPDRAAFEQNLLAVEVGGQVRSFIPAGAEVTYGGLFELLPFDNMVSVVAVTGRDLEALVEGAFWNVRGGAPFLSSGLQAQVAADDAPGARVRDLSANGRPVEPEATYWLVTNDYVATGRQGFRRAGLKDRPRVVSALTARDALWEHLTSLGGGLLSADEGRARVALE